MNIVHTRPSTETEKMLAALQESVSKVLEQKKRLGQYAVLWHDNKPIMQGADAPSPTQPPLS